MSAGDLLQWLSMAQKTGTLTLSSQSIEKRIFFNEGRVLSSASTDPREYLGQFLMSHGYITEGQLQRAMEEQRESKALLGKILVRMGAVTEENLLRLMRLKAEEEIYDIFLWSDGEFVFKDGELPQVELVPLHVDVTGIVMEGHRRIDEWKRIRLEVPHRRKVPVLERPVDVENMSESRRRIVQAINGQRTIEQIVLESRSSEFHVSSAVFDLVQEGAARVVDPPKPEVAPFDLGAGDDDDDEVSSLLTRAQNALKKGDFEKALRILKAAQNLDPNNSKVKNAYKGAETLISGELRRGGLVESKVPKLVKPIEELSTMNFSPNEGFILSRINGIWDIGSIMKISPMREADALMIFQKLATGKIITLS